MKELCGVLGQITDRRKDFQTDGKIELAEDPMKLKTTQSGKTGSLIKRSAILAHGTSWTIILKEAVLECPQKRCLVGQRQPGR
ncbi:MAG: hypothetical protein OSB65_14020 [Roseibacillus sp.]|nr:hypothetical protein [Roseibacillus sp.]